MTDSRMGLPLNESCVRMVSPAQTVKELKLCGANRSEDEETKKHEIQAVGVTRLLLSLFAFSSMTKAKAAFFLTTARRRHTNHVNTIMDDHRDKHI